MNKGTLTSLTIIVGLTIIIVLLVVLILELKNHKEQPRIINATVSQQAYVYEVIWETGQYDFVFAFEKMSKGDLVIVSPEVFGGQIIPLAKKDQTGSAKITEPKPWGSQLFVYLVSDDGVVRQYISDEIMFPGQRVFITLASISCGNYDGSGVKFHDAITLSWAQSKFF